jgi:Uma2 family endonuclease
MSRSKPNKWRLLPNVAIIGPMSTTAFQFESFEAFSPFSDVGPYRAADYWLLPEGAPIELIRGRFVMSPSPVPRHQIVMMLLTEIFLQIARRSGGIALCAPMDVVLSDDTILQPDLLYVALPRRAIVKRRVEGAPDLVIEIISGTSRRDRVEKLDVYARFGVAEYWIVDPETQLFEFLINEAGRFIVHSPVNDRYQSSRLPEVEIQLADFWREVEERLPSS